MTASQVADVIRSWVEARDDLEIEVIAPYQIGGHVALALVRSFGSPQGTVVIAIGVDREEESQVRQAARAAGCSVSILSASSYSTYDRELFVATLNDWGWHGPRDRIPTWYSGESWTT